MPLGLALKSRNLVPFPVCSLGFTLAVRDVSSQLSAPGLAAGADLLPGCFHHTDPEL